MLDGHFSPDGQSLAVTDVAGQVHIYGLGGRDSLRCVLSCSVAMQMEASCLGRARQRRSACT